MKRLMTIQDISCIGKCSLTVALPIISSMGIETAIVPTAVLSTHTQFPNFTFRDLTDDLEPIKNHWKSQGFEFGTIYTGYLGSQRQIEIVSDFFDTFGSKDNYIVVDPAMAEDGVLYPGFDNHFAKEMKKLCAKADIILPNISEACLMLGEPYPGEDASLELLQELLKKLVALGCDTAVITGVSFSDGTLGFLGYHKKNKEFFSYGTEKIPYRSHGTGDVFSSTFSGALTKGLSIEEALKIAADYTCACIKNTYKDPEHVTYAVNFEAEIPYLLKLLSITPSE
ncbi:MAG: pyridoxamine kinase [Eubacterium sp.]|nr:pyridoxamine kinase [Eubacterium sp.]